MDFTLLFRDKGIRELYHKLEINASYKNMLQLMPICIFAFTLHLIWSLIAKHAMQTIVSKLIFTIFVVAMYLFGRNFKRVYTVAGYLYVTFLFIMYTYQVEMDTAYAVRCYIISNYAAINFTVFAQINWILSVVIYSVVPLYYWYEISDKIEDGFATEMFYMQF